MPHVRAPLSGAVGRTGANRGAAHRASAASIARSALVPALLLMAVLGRPSLRGQSIASDSSATAAVVLEHFAASQTEGTRWRPVEMTHPLGGDR
jgi:hypothetical protein